MVHHLQAACTSTHITSPKRTSSLAVDDIESARHSAYMAVKEFYLCDNVRGFLDFTSRSNDRIDMSDTHDLIQKAKESARSVVANETYLDSGASGFIYLMEND